MMGGNHNDLLRRVQNYRKIVLIYEALDAEIDKLFEKYNGSDEMPPEDLERYRDLARKRDDVYNEMLSLEQHLLDDDNLENLP